MPLTIPPGWREIIQTARVVADEVFEVGDAGAVVEATGLDGRGRLLLRISSSLPAHGRGVAAAAHALSGEICDQCGGPGDPVRRAGTPTRTTRCSRCRGTGDEVLPRPAWRRDRDRTREAVDPNASFQSYRSCPVVEDFLSDEDLTALMEARQNPRGDRGWPLEAVQLPHGPYWLIEDTGWNPLIRAAFMLLLPMQCEGQTGPIRLSAVRAQSYQLGIEGYNFDTYQWGIARFLQLYSATTCIRCGRRAPIPLPDNPWRGRECEACWTRDHGHSPWT